MLIDLKREIIHDSAMPEYREPVGAVKTGEAVTLRLKIRCPDVQSVYLRLFSEGYERMVMMSPSEDIWSAVVAPPETPDVYWYYFCVNIAGRVSYYGADGGRTSGAGNVFSDPPPAFQLTVYDAGFDTPAWFKKSVMYQIFPDRFRRSGTETVRQGLAYHQGRGRKVYYHEDWNEMPLYRAPEGGTQYSPNDYFGGTLKGIEESLSDLKRLGISVIYLNPVLEAASNHRYNTADYMKIDPVLGTNEDFKSLCAEAKKLDIRIILDGVFSHTGSDSIYFNRENAYESVGAYQGAESPYYGWYKFDSCTSKYQCWWGFTTLPEVDEHNPGWQDFIIKSDDSVLRHWIGEGAAGYRLDVADELPDDVIALMRQAVKQKDENAVLIGEVWEDATTKYSYGAKRKFALGRELDSVTNYPLRDALVDFLTGKSDAEKLKDFLVSQAVSYPPPMYYSLMNMLSSHDIERIRTALSVGIDVHALTREQQASFAVSPAQDLKGARLQRLAAAMQFSLPGVPCVYYGDETGMQGMLDPFNRATWRKGVNDLTKFYASLGGIRNASGVLSTGRAAFIAPHPDCIGILRYVSDSRDALGEDEENGVIFTTVNRSDRACHVVFDFLGTIELLSARDKQELRQAFKPVARCLLSEDTYEVVDGLLEITLPPFGLAMIKLA